MKPRITRINVVPAIPPQNPIFENWEIQLIPKNARSVNVMKIKHATPKIHPATNIGLNAVVAANARREPEFSPPPTILYSLMNGFMSLSVR